MIDIINYGLGNLNSIANIIRKVGGEVRIINSPEELNAENKLILPGVGSFDHGMKNLASLNWIEKLNEVVLIKKIPILGICLGMQLMCKQSEEGELTGLGWINADVIKFKFEDTMLKIPHMGWNNIKVEKPNNIIEMNEEEKRYYFVHSFYVKSNDKADVLATTNYPKPFVSAFNKDNIHGVQFHPEKSHRFGMQLLKNFINV
jgi:glutamine amidotransferase